MTRDLPTLLDAKAHAKRLREELEAEGVQIGHSQALETIAHRHGFRDWNALHAAIRKTPERAYSINQRVTGRYLAQPFTATVLSVKEQHPGWFHLMLDLDEAVDVVRFEGLSNLRKRIQIEVGPEGLSEAHTSDGTPHIELDR